MAEPTPEQTSPGQSSKRSASEMRAEHLEQLKSDFESAPKSTQEKLLRHDNAEAWDLYRQAQAATEEKSRDEARAVIERHEARGVGWPKREAEKFINEAPKRKAETEVAWAAEALHEKVKKSRAEGKQLKDIVDEETWSAVRTKRARDKHLADAIEFGPLVSTEVLQNTEDQRRNYFNEARATEDQHFHDQYEVFSDEAKEKIDEARDQRWAEVEVLARDMLWQQLRAEAVSQIIEMRKQGIPVSDEQRREMYQRVDEQAGAKQVPQELVEVAMALHSKQHKAGKYLATQERARWEMGGGQLSELRWTLENLSNWQRFRRLERRAERYRRQKK